MGAGRVSGLKRGNRKGWDQRVESSEREFRAAVLSSRMELVRLDLKLGRAFAGRVPVVVVVVVVVVIGGERVKPSSGLSSSEGKEETRG